MKGPEERTLAVGQSPSMTAEAKLLDLLAGQDVLVDVGSLPTDPPPWYDADKFRRGKDFCRRNYAGISMAHFVSLITMLVSPSILKPLIFTRMSETVEKSFKRYIGTLVHVTAWYSGDIWAPESVARKSIQIVRGMHNRVARQTNDPKRKPQVDSCSIAQCGQLFDKDPSMLSAIQQDVQSIPECPYAALRANNRMVKQPNDGEYIYVNQFDMADTQYAFLGAIILFPRQFGAKFYNDDDLRGFIHMWRCIGYMLGIQDRFNLCHNEDLDHIKEFCRLYLEKMIKPAFKNATAEYEHMARAVAKGARNYNPGVTYESLFAYYAYAVGLPFDNVRRSMSYGQYSHYLYLRLMFFLCWIPGFMHLFSALVKFLVGLVVDRSSSCWPRSWNPPQVDGLQQFWRLEPTDGHKTVADGTNA